MTLETIRRLLPQLSGTRVVVIGDVMLDEYLHGDVSRISPEAPVPVMDLRRREFRVGGAANAAANVASVGGKVVLVGVVGNDPSAELLRQSARELGIDDSGLIAVADRPTSCKTRVVARGQQVVRIDHEHRTPLAPALEAEIIERIRTLLRGAQACIVSDYAKGVVTRAVAQAAIEEAVRCDVPVVVDPKSRDFSIYRGATVITPNLRELEMATGIHADTDEQVLEVGGSVLPVIAPASLLVTRGAAGMTLLRTGHEPLHVPTAARLVFDVTGAGDTVVGLLAVGLGARARYEDVLAVANAGAGVVVGKLGATAVTAAEILAHLEAPADGAKPVG